MVIFNQDSSETEKNMGETLQKKRIAWIDNARAIAIFFIVLGHINVSGQFCTYLNSFHVPLFFFISGLTFSAKDKPLDFLKKKVKRILVPYLIFSSISIFIYLVFGKAAANKLEGTDYMLSLRQCIYGMLYGARGNGFMSWNRPLWFLPCLFSLLVIAYLIRRFIFRNSDNIVFTVASLIICFLMFRKMLYVNYFPVLPFGLTQAASASPFFILGILTRQVTDSCGEKIKLKIGWRIALCAVLIAAGAFVNSRNTTFVGFSYNQFGNLWIYTLSAVLSVFGWCLFSGLFRSKAVEYVGNNTMTILVMHKFPIVFYSLISIPGLSENIFIGILFSALTVAMCLGVGFIIERICPFIIGKEKRRSNAQN